MWDRRDYPGKNPHRVRQWRNRFARHGYKLSDVGREDDLELMQFLSEEGTDENIMEIVSSDLEEIETELYRRPFLPLPVELKGRIHLGKGIGSECAASVDLGAGASPMHHALILGGIASGKTTTAAHIASQARAFANVVLIDSLNAFE